MPSLLDVSAEASLGVVISGMSGYLHRLGAVALLAEASTIKAKGGERELEASS